MCVCYICSNKMKAPEQVALMSSKNTCLSFSLSSCLRCFSCFCLFSPGTSIPPRKSSVLAVQPWAKSPYFVWRGDLRGQLLFTTNSAVTIEVFPNFNVSFSACYQHTKCSIYLTITQFHCYSHNKSLGEMKM